jgi:hypothetical protein
MNAVPVGPHGPLKKFSAPPAQQMSERTVALSSTRGCPATPVAYMRIHLACSPQERDERCLFAGGKAGDIHLDCDRFEIWQWRGSATASAVAARQSSALAMRRLHDLPVFFTSDMEVEITYAVPPDASESELISC